MTAPVSKVLSDEEWGYVLKSATGMHGGGAYGRRLREDRAAMRAERASMLELIAELAEALDDSGDPGYGSLIARAQALASEK